MRLTDLAIASKEVRTWRKAITMEGSIARRLDWHLKHSAKSIGAGHISRAREIMAACRREAASETPGREINSYLSSRPILNLPVGEVLDWIFAGLPKPGPAQHDDYTQTLVTMMNNIGRDNRARQHQYLLMLEMAYRTYYDWYIIFNTLTVRSGAYHTVFAKDSKEFKNYVRNFEREITYAETGTRNTPRGHQRPDNHRYFACVEEGGTTGRLHIHIVHLCRTLPDRSHDPNCGRPRPTQREITSLKRLWRHGYSTPIAARFSPLDAYGKAGWRWPIDMRTNDALQIKSPLALANYMSKYINKGYTSCKRAELLWRVRKTQNLGIPILEELLSTLTPVQLMILASDDSLNLKLNNQRIPPQLLRIHSLKRLNHLSTTNTSDLPPLTEIAQTVTPRLSLLHSSRVSTLTIRECNQPSITPTLTDNISSTDDYNEQRAALYRAARAIDNKYFRRSLLRGGKQNTADWIHPKNEHHAQIKRLKHTDTSIHKAVK